MAAGLKLHQLQALATCAEAGSIRGGARALGISQAAVTRALRELESSQGVELLIRSSAGLAFTDAGRTLVRHAEAILAQMSRAADDVARMREQAHAGLSIGISPWVARAFLPEIIALFRTRAPEIRLEFFESLMTVAQPMLRTGKLNFVFGAFPGVDSAGSDLAIEPFLECETGILVREGHSHASCRSIHDLLGLDWVLNLPADARGNLLMTIFGQFGAQMDENRIITAHTQATVETMVSMADMCTWAPKVYCNLPSTLVRFTSVPIVEAYAPRTLGVISRRDTPQSDLALELIDCIKTAVRRKLRQTWRSKDEIFRSVRLL